MTRPIRNPRAHAILLALLFLTAGRITPTVFGDNPEKPLGVAIEEKRAKVKKLEQSAKALRQSFREWQRDLVAEQEIATRQADAKYQNAKLTRQVAEIAVVEYKEGTSAIQKQKADGEIRVAKDELRRAKEAFEQDKSNVNRLRLDQAQLKLETAEAKLEILGKFTKPRTLRELESEVERAKSDELYAEAMLNLEKTKAKRVQLDAAERKSPAPEQQILILLDESIALEEKVRGALEEAKALEAKVKQEPAAVEALMEDLRQKKAQVANLTGKAIQQLDEAIFRANEVTAKRAKLRQSEQALQKAQAELDALEAKAKAK